MHTFAYHWEHFGTKKNTADIKIIFRKHVCVLLWLGGDMVCRYHQYAFTDPASEATLINMGKYITTPHLLMIQP